MLETDAPPQARLTRERVEATEVLRLNRPARRNALDSELVGDLHRALLEAEAEPDVAAVVLAGAAPGFCAGSDLKELAGLSPSEQVLHEARSGELAAAIGGLRIPVIAAVTGFAIGGGFLLATSCDLVVCEPESRWELPEAALGWVPPWGLGSLVARVGPAVARRLAWGTERLDGRQAHALGVADELAEAGAVEARALALAARLARVSGAGVASVKEVFAAALPGAGLDHLALARFAADVRSAPARDSLAGFGSARRVR